MLTAIESLFRLLVRLLSWEASKKAKLAASIQRKVRADRDNELDTIAAIKKSGDLYRTGLNQQADINERHADRASALASKIGSILQ